jgi:hypothetical protein
MKPEERSVMLVPIKKNTLGTRTHFTITSVTGLQGKMKLLERFQRNTE